MKRILLGLIFCFALSNLQAQVGLQAGEKLLLISNMYQQPIPKIEIVTKKADSNTSPTSIPTWSFSESNVYDEHFGFFCKVEVKLDKIAKVPMRFRLGSIDYVNSLEGK